MAEPRYERDLVDLLNDAGYTTALVGKDHTYRQGALRGLCSPPATRLPLPPVRLVRRRNGPSRPGASRPAGGLVALGARAGPTGSRKSRRRSPPGCSSRSGWWTRPSSCSNRCAGSRSTCSSASTRRTVPTRYRSRISACFLPAEIPPPAAGKEVLEGRNFQWRFSRRLIEEHFPEPERLVPRYRANYCGMLRLIDDQGGAAAGLPGAERPEREHGGALHLGSLRLRRRLRPAPQRGRTAGEPGADPDGLARAGDRDRARSPAWRTSRWWTCCRRCAACSGWSRPRGCRGGTCGPLLSGAERRGGARLDVRRSRGGGQAVCSRGRSAAARGELHPEVGGDLERAQRRHPDRQVEDGGARETGSWSRIRTAPGSSTICRPIRTS